MAPVRERQSNLTGSPSHHSVGVLEGIQQIRDVHLQQNTEQIREPLQDLEPGLRQEIQAVDVRLQRARDGPLGANDLRPCAAYGTNRSEEHTSELQSRVDISYA